MEFRAECFRFQGPLDPGDYIIPFEFALPANLPASMVYENRRISGDPWIKIKHTIQAIVNMHDNSMIKYKQWIIVHEPPVPFVANSATTSTAEVKSCGCFAKGSANMTALFSKNVFYSNETAYADVTYDNSKSGLAVKEIEFQVRQKLRIQAGGHHCENRIDVIECKDLEPVKQFETKVQTKRMSLNLA